jgi:hypothetical protein
MRRNLPLRFWLASLLAALCVVLLVVTLFVHDWIERLSGLSPDGGDGALEFAPPFLLLVLLGVSALAARRIHWAARQMLLEGIASGSAGTYDDAFRARMRERAAGRSA